MKVTFVPALATLGGTTLTGSFLFYVTCIEIIVNYDLYGRMPLSWTDSFGNVNDPSIIMAALKA
jgi:hypothetical protein